MYDEEYAYTGRWDAVLIFELSSIEAGRQAGRQVDARTVATLNVSFLITGQSLQPCTERVLKR